MGHDLSHSAAAGRNAGARMRALQKAKGRARGPAF